MNAEDLEFSIHRQNVLQSVTARQNFLRELKVFVRLVLRSHPSPDTLI
jgi:hypothetical protein